MMDDGADSSGGDAVAASSDDGTTSASTTSGSTSGGGLDADKLSEAIAAARKDLESGKVEKAIGKLETARDLFEPDEEQRKEIDDLISKARREVAVKKNYDRAREALGQDKFVAAMQHLTEIPSHSIFADLAGEKKLYETARAGAVAAAQQALDDDREKKARELADEVLLHHPEDSDAKAILAELEKREEQRRVVAARASRNRKSSSNRSSSSGSSSNKTSSSKPSPDEAKKLYASAMKKLARGNFNASIKDCKQGLRGGQHRCNVIIGMAYKQQNNKKNACRYFKKYLSTNPSDAAAIQRQVDQLGCP
jgi:tetratricopeptide (TPR) repeat protein